MTSNSGTRSNRSVRLRNQMAHRANEPPSAAVAPLVVAGYRVFEWLLLNQRGSDWRTQPRLRHLMSTEARAFCVNPMRSHHCARSAIESHRLRRNTPPHHVGSANVPERCHPNTMLSARGGIGWKWTVSPARPADHPRRKASRPSLGYQDDQPATPPGVGPSAWRSDECGARLQRLPAFLVASGREFPWAERQYRHDPDLFSVGGAAVPNARRGGRSCQTLQGGILLRTSIADGSTSNHLERSSTYI